VVALFRDEDRTRIDVDGERPVALSERVVDVIEDYRRVNRPDVSDDQGRRPLIAPLGAG
jgi:hypothetical protein